MKDIIIKTKDGYEISGQIYDCKSPKAVIQVMHGMEEYKKRYIPLADFLSKNGYIVLITDMRGHGEHCKDLGYFAKKDGYKLLIQDQKDIREYLKVNFLNLPLYIFAHSMGTITARNLLQQDSKEYQKVVLSGYPNYQGAAKAGIAVCKLVAAFKGDHHKSNLVKGMAFGAFAKSIKDRKTDFDWLSYNDKNVNEYIKDPLCGYGFTVSGYKDLFSLVANLKSSKAYKNVNKDLKILLISGKEDPCTGFDKGREHSKKVLSNAGFNSIKVITYEHARHEILNEDIKNQVFEDILDFFNE